MNFKLTYKNLIVIVFALMQLNVFAQSKTYEINTDVAAENIDSTSLHLGGSDNAGDKISINNYYISYNNKPIIPVTGEFHFSRYPEQYWDENLKKMKAGGINTVATYVFWNMHEEHEGNFVWSGNRNLRRFVELCDSNHLNVIVRIGPFDHGEIRNGGLPDWLLAKPLIIRSNDSAYLFYVNRLYAEISKQLKGLYFKDGGPIIGIQLENEYQHSASPWGLTYPGQPYEFTVAERDAASAHEGVSVASSKNNFAEEGNEHMATLKKLAIAAGMDVPIYTTTGWGFAALVPNGSLPVTAAYAYPTWTEGKDLSPFYLYKKMHDNPDYSPVRYKPNDYPVFAAELGSGIMSTYQRRPIVPAKSMDAMINRCLGSGANGIGYYMYCGGSTPKGDFFFNDEAYGYPKISYDFQAPIGEYGDVRPGFQRLKLVNIFCNEFGDVLAPMQTVLPENNPSKPDDVADLRYAVRVKDGSGFLFLNNFQDDTTLTDKKNIQVKINTLKGAVTIPENGGIDLPDGENIIFPFNFNADGIHLNYATAQPFAKGTDINNMFYVFFTLPNAKAEFSFANKDGVIISNSNDYSIEKNNERILVKCKTSKATNIHLTYKNRQINILVVDKTLALQAYIVNINGEKHIAFSNALVLQYGNSLTLLNDSSNETQLQIYPAIHNAIQVTAGNIIKQNNPVFSSYQITVPEVRIILKQQKISDKKYALSLPLNMDKNLNDIFLNIDYVGDTGMGFLDNELVTDEFYKGIPWHIGLKRFINPINKEMIFYFRPMYKNASYLVDLNKSSIPDFGKQDNYLEIKSFTTIPEYKTSVQFNK